MKSLPEIVLKPGEEQRLFSGHPWIFDNEIASFPEAFTDGSLAFVKTSGGFYAGMCYANTNSKITARMLDTLKEPAEIYTGPESIEALLEIRILAAIKRREKIKGTNAIRMIFSESDLLPGLIVDMYASTMVMQINTLGMEKLKPVLVGLLEKSLNPAVIYEKSLSGSREKEGLKRFEGNIKGQAGPVIIEENGLKFEVNPVSGSKTGFYLDQRDNRERIKDYCAGEDVFDLFCYTGSFSAFALKFGAKSARSVDSSDAAIMAAEKNMEINGLDNYCLVKSDVFDELKRAASAGEKYGLIILDPPPFSKSGAEKAGGIKGYKDLHRKAFKVLKDNGVIFTFSCSNNISMAELIKSAKDAARNLKMRIEILGQLFQAKDHPYNTAIPETFYLKGAIIRKK
jgi:23S rRNA (cytosine1962-C5)-methyltransferase